MGTDQQHAALEQAPAQRIAVVTAVGDDCAAVVAEGVLVRPGARQSAPRCFPPASLPPDWPRPIGFPKEHLGRRPPPSTSCLCRVWFRRRTRPLFRRSKTAIQKRLTPVQLAALVQLREKLSPYLEPYPVLFPLAQPAPAGAGTGIFLGQIPPTRPSLEPPQDAFKHAPVFGPRPTATPTLGQKRFDPGPLLIGQECFLHPQLLTKMP